MESSRLRSSRRLISRWARVPALPNIRSNSTRGLISIGSGVAASAHDSVFEYAQL